MRKILFRGKRTDNGEWVRGSLISLDSDSDYVFICEPYEHASTLPAKELVYKNMVLVNKKTVGQYIGLDKNGTKIFEGDIVQWKTPVNTYIQSMVSYKAEQSAFCIYIRNIGYVPLTREHVKEEDFSLIGNFYDNPEFIKK